MQTRHRDKNPRFGQQRDYGMIGIMTLLVLIAAWVLLMPLVPAIAGVTLRRFHLRSNSFVSWAVQFPIPAMYNFANRYEVNPATNSSDPDSSEPVDSDADELVVGERLINHFPVRIFTFADGRHYYLREGEDRWLTVRSSYRGQTLESRFHADPDEAGDGYVLRRLDPPESH
ncbi:MAG: hypothetical protein AAGI63_08725 [Planctomycetota bacterium]